MDRAARPRLVSRLLGLDLYLGPLLGFLFVREKRLSLSRTKKPILRAFYLQAYVLDDGRKRELSVDQKRSSICGENRCGGWVLGYESLNVVGSKFEMFRKYGRYQRRHL